MKNDYYVYFHRNSITNEIFYVGKGRANRCNTTKGRSSIWMNYLQTNSCDFVVEKIKENLTDLEAKKLEKHYIASLENLVNVKKDNEWNSDLLNVSKYFKYSLESPTFLVWKTPIKYGKKRAGDVAGSFDKGYVKITLNYKQYLAHRIIWVMFNNTEIPEGMVINHKDCNPSNNAIENLECVSFAENNRSKAVHISDSTLSSNSSGINGVYLSKSNPQGNGGCTYYNWTAIVYENEKPANRSFSILKYGENLAKEMAIAWRKAKEPYNSDKYLSDELVKAFNSKYNYALIREFPIGISLCKNHGKPAQTFEASIIKDGLKKSKRFSINKYGYDEAYRLACEWRKQMEELYYK